MTAEKAPRAYRTAAELAEELDIPLSQIRHWAGLFPDIRPTINPGGRRHYSPRDVEMFQGIRHLMHDAGMTSKGVLSVIEQKGADFVRALGRGEASLF